MKKTYNIDNVKHYLALAIKETGNTPAEILAVAKANGRAALTNAAIESALGGKGWTAGGDVTGAQVVLDCVSYPVDLLAARDLLAWMINK